jgi:hypothetical protein
MSSEESRSCISEPRFTSLIQESTDHVSTERRFYASQVLVASASYPFVFLNEPQQGQDSEAIRKVGFLPAIVDKLRQAKAYFRRGPTLDRSSVAAIDVGGSQAP